MGELGVTREAFLALNNGQPRYEQVEVAGLGTVHIKRLNAGEKDRFEMAVIQNDRRDFRARLVAHTACDSRGAHLFTDDDVSALAEFDPATLDPIVKVAVKINGLTAEDQEELRKNSNGQVAIS